MIKSPMAKKQHHPLTEELADQLIFVLEKGKPFVTKFELDVVLDRAEAFSKYGPKAVITPKQVGVVKTAYRKTKLSAALEEHLTKGV